MAIKYRIREEILRNGNRTFYVEYKRILLDRWENVTEVVSGYRYPVKRATLEEAKSFVLQQKLEDAKAEAQRKATEIVKVKYHG